MKIAYIYNSMTTFMRQDLDILSQVYEIQAVDFQIRPSAVAQLTRAVMESDIVFCWFAGRHALLAVMLAKLFHKKSIVITGGYDVANMPEIEYGSMYCEPTRSMVRLIVNLADRIVAFSKSSQEELICNTGVNKHKARMIYIGVPDENTYLSTRKEPMVLTAGNVNWSNLKRKGMEPFVRAAGLLPDIPFILAGKWEDGSIEYLQKIATNNVKFSGFISRMELFDNMRRAKVYVQASAHEGFGLALAEAMLWGCIPVVTNRGSLPEVTGGIGVTVPFDDVPALAQGIEHALGLDTDISQKARQHVITNFSLEERRNKLLKVVQEVSLL